MNFQKKRWMSFLIFIFVLTFFPAFAVDPVAAPGAAGYRAPLPTARNLSDVRGMIIPPESFDGTQVPCHESLRDAGGQDGAPG